MIYTIILNLHIFDFKPRKLSPVSPPFTYKLLRIIRYTGYLEESTNKVKMVVIPEVKFLGVLQPRENNN